MRVLYVIDSLSGGGAERSLAALAPHYARRDVELTVAYLYERDNVYREQIEHAGARIVTLNGPGGIAGRVVRAHRLCHSIEPAVVHTTLYDADLVGRVACLGSHVTVVTTLANEAYGPEQRRNAMIQPWKLRLAQGLDSLTARRVNRFHAVSENVKNVMGRRLHLPAERIDVIPRGRDPQELGCRGPERRALTRAQLGVADEQFLVVAIGRHEYQKGFDVLLRAFGNVHRAQPTARLVIAGPVGNATPALHEERHRSGMTAVVDFLGFRADVPDLLVAADIFVAPSRWEGSPGAVIEAMALEVPIVATETPSMREVVDERSARLVPPDDARALAHALIESVEDHDNGELVTAARDQFLTRFTIERTAEQMIAFYERAVETR
jgi:glycosyltransferase involved in cell wall biosynthesis